jgi:O-antigen/teichoic acid export membrane protein
MREHVRKLGGQTLLYGLGDGVSRLIALLLLPVFSRVLSPAEYGTLAIAGLVGTLASIVLESGQRTAYFRLFYRDPSEEARRRLTGTVLVYLIVAAGVLLPAFHFLLHAVGGRLGWDRATPALLDLVLAATFFDIGSVVPFAVFRAEQRAGQYARLVVVRAVLLSSLNLIAVVGLRAGVPGVLTANLVTSAVFFVLCLALTTRGIIWKPDLRLLRELLAFGLPHIPANLAGWVLTLSDRLFLEKYAGLSQVGVYAIGYAIAGGVYMLMGWFNTAWAPYAMSLSARPDARVVYDRLLTYGMAAFAFLALGAGLFAREAVTVLAPPAYLAAARVVPIIAAAYLAYELYYLLSLGFDLTGKPWLPSISIFIAANIGMNASSFSMRMMGAAWTTLASYALLLLVYPVVRHLSGSRIAAVSFSRS